MVSFCLSAFEIYSYEMKRDRGGCRASPNSVLPAEYKFRPSVHLKSQILNKMVPSNSQANTANSHNRRRPRRRRGAQSPRPLEASPELVRVIATLAEADRVIGAGSPQGRRSPTHQHHRQSHPRPCPRPCHNNGKCGGVLQKLQIDCYCDENQCREFSS
jgi:hypothetical protein